MIVQQDTHSRIPRMHFVLASIASAESACSAKGMHVLFASVYLGDHATGQTGDFRPI
jgi:hypothetical protein